MVTEEEANIAFTKCDDGGMDMIEVDFDNWKNGRVPGEINNFSAMVFMLVAKADPVNREKLKREWPEHVAMYEAWVTGPNA